MIVNSPMAYLGWAGAVLRLEQQEQYPWSSRMLVLDFRAYFVL